MPEVQPQERWWDNPASGRKLFTRVWMPSSPRGWVVLVHGFAEHGGRYLQVGSALAGQGIGVVCTDLPGHGRSSWRRGDCVSINDYVDELQAVVRVMCSPKQPLTVFGHSLGGLIAIRWSLNYPTTFRALALQGPLLQLGFPVPAWKRAVASGLAACWPTMSLPTGLNSAWLSHDEDVVRAYRRDPRVLRTITVRAFFAIEAASEQARQQANRLRLPTLMLWGEADRVVSVPACEQFYGALSCEKRSKTFPGCFHELHHESVRDEALQELVQWVVAHG